MFYFSDVRLSRRMSKIQVDSCLIPLSFQPPLTACRCYFESYNHIRKSIDYMNFQSDRVQIQKILANYKIPPEEQNDIISLMYDLSKNYQVLAIYLYGSYARMEPKPYSDIDIAVITQMTDPLRDLKEIIGSYSSKKLDVQVFSDLPLPARMQVLAQGVPLYIRNEDSLWSVIKSVSLSYMDLEPMRNRCKERLLGV